jgi:hypothetical protein
VQSELQKAKRSELQKSPLKWSELRRRSYLWHFGIKKSILKNFLTWLNLT